MRSFVGPWVEICCWTKATQSKAWFALCSALPKQDLFHYFIDFFSSLSFWVHHTPWDRCVPNLFDHLETIMITRSHFKERKRRATLLSAHCNTKRIGWWSDLLLGREQTNKKGQHWKHGSLHITLSNLRSIWALAFLLLDQVKSAPLVSRWVRRLTSVQALNFSQARWKGIIPLLCSRTPLMELKSHMKLQGPWCCCCKRVNSPPPSSLHLIQAVEA